MTQNLNDKIEEFGKAVEFDADNGYPFYRSFISKTRVKFGLKLEEAEDIWQDKMLKFISINTNGHHPIEIYKHDIDGEKGFNDEKLSGWLMSSLFNECIDYLRKKELRKKIGENVQIPINERGEDLSLLLVGTEEEPLDEMIREENKGLVGRCLAQMTPKQRDILQVINYEGLKYREAAERLGVPIGTIQSGYYKSKKKFRKLYESIEAA